MVRQNTLPPASPDSARDAGLADALGALLQAQGIACTAAELRGATRTWLRLAPSGEGSRT